MIWRDVAAAIAVAVSACALAAPALAQEEQAAAVDAPADEEAADEAPPQPAASIDPAGIEVPDLAFAEAPGDAEGYDKYFYFVREDTDFATAYADILECDGYARGFSFVMTGGPVPYPYAGTLGGAIGGAIGAAMADAIFGSAERRKMRRANLRTCMGYKGYRRFGLPKDVWARFNFEEGNSPPPEKARMKLLQQQAKVASGPMPAAGELGR